MMRGINHQKIFDSDDDCRKFVKIIHSLKHRPGEGNGDSDWMILAYALMTNHFHLLVKEGDVTVGDLIKKIAGAYVKYYNRKNRRDGHLFKERFKSEVCEDDDYFMTLLRYIHQNPVKARMVDDVADYEFTSWHEYIDDGKCDQKICNTQYVLDRIDLEQLRELVYTPLTDNVKCLEYPESGRFRLTDEEATEIFYRFSGLRGKEEFRLLHKNEKVRLLRLLKGEGLGTKQLSRIAGCGIGTIVKACRGMAPQGDASAESRPTNPCLLYKYPTTRDS